METYLDSFAQSMLAGTGRRDGGANADGQFWGTF